MWVSVWESCPGFGKYILKKEPLDKFTFQSMIVSGAHCSLQREEYCYMFFSYFDPSIQQGKADRTVIQMLINKTVVIFAIFILLKNYISTEAPISCITRVNTGKRNWNSSLRRNSKRSFPTCALSSKTYYSGVSDNLCACYLDFWWIRLNVIITSIQVF